jgi:hypothetical protein
MPWIPAAIGGGASLLGGLIGGDAAGDAAATQAAATDRSNARLEKQYQQTRTDLSPWRTTGMAANNKLAQLLGLDNGGFSGGMTADQARTQLLPQYTKTTSGGMVYQGPSSDSDGRWVQGGDGSSTVDENGLSAAIQQLMSQQQPSTNPQGADYGSLLKPFTGADLVNEPGYQFGLQQGQTALDRRAQGAGNYFSGAALKGAARFGTDYASTKYGDAYNRDASTKRQQFDFLNGTSTSGQNAATQTANSGTAMAGQIGANTTAMGNAAGASQIAQGNALSGGINNAVNGYQQNELVNKIMGGNAGFGGSRVSAPSIYDDGYGTGQGSSYSGNYARM